MSIRTTMMQSPSPSPRSRIPLSSPTPRSTSPGSSSRMPSPSTPRRGAASISPPPTAPGAPVKSAVTSDLPAILSKYQSNSPTKSQAKRSPVSTRSLGTDSRVSSPKSGEAPYSPARSRSAGSRIPSPVSSPGRSPQTAIAPVRGRATRSRIPSPTFSSARPRAPRSPIAAKGSHYVSAHVSEACTSGSLMHVLSTCGH